MCPTANRFCCNKYKRGYTQGKIFVACVCVLNCAHSGTDKRKSSFNAKVEWLQNSCQFEKNDPPCLNIVLAGGSFTPFFSTCRNWPIQIWRFKKKTNKWSAPAAPRVDRPIQKVIVHTSRQHLNSIERLTDGHGNRMRRAIKWHQGYASQHKSMISFQNKIS